MPKTSITSKKGFTLVETLVAISILVIALTGPLAIIASSLRSSYFSRDEITAAYLAQEPIEFIRNMRDQNTLRSSNSSFWLKGNTSDSDLTTDYTDHSATLMSVPGALTKTKVKLVWTGGVYRLERCGTECRVTYDPRVAAGSPGVLYGSTADGVTDSIYTRDIYLTKADSDPSSDDIPERELVITVVVSWHTGGLSHNVTVTEHLFNWELENQS